MPEEVKLKIVGMTCQHCVMRVTKAVEGIEGVSNVKVDLASGVLRGTVDSAVTIRKIREAVREAGYGVEEQHG
jgi:copper ion binding protein